MDDLKELKSVLRSLVVSTPVQMTLSMLLRDYRNMVGTHLPIHKYGYRDPLQFLRERCGDCFLGSGINTVLTPIIPESLKHINEFVNKQRVSTKTKYLGKRRSINESAMKPAPNLIAQTFEANCTIRPETSNPARERQPFTPQKNGLQKGYETRPPEKKLPPPPNLDSPPKTVDSNMEYKSVSNHTKQDLDNKQQDSSPPSNEAYKNFLRRRLPVYDSTQDLDRDSKSNKDSDSGAFTSESEQRTLSGSSSSAKALQLEQLKAELLQIVKDSPNGVRITDLMKLYRERYGRELDLSRFGFASVSVLAGSLQGVHAARDAAGNTRVSLGPPAPHAAPRPPHAPHAPHAHARPRPIRSSKAVIDDEDALPGIDFDPDVFPADCMSFNDVIPAAGLEGVHPSAMLDVMVGEVYSPSHFWFQRVGEQYNIAMNAMMDDMTKYYQQGEGAARTLALGAVRLGHYCSSMYDNDWHRSLIVKIIDSDTVKVRHVDYGTVDRVAVGALKPLLRGWGALPAQALRARLAGVRPAARGRRWPHAACVEFLRLVRERRLAANVVHVDHEENIVEVLLVDTSTERDVRIDLELVRTGHADPLAAPAADALAASYLYPRFDALESGDTPNLGDINVYLRDGIALEYVEDYSRHVPAALPADLAPPAPLAPAPAPPTRALDNRVPLIPRPRSLADVKAAVVAPVERHDATYDLSSSTELVNEEPAEQTAGDESCDDGPDERPRDESVRAEIGNVDVAAYVELPATVERETDREEASAPSPPTTRPEPEAPKLAEVSPEKTKPACWAIPRMVPDIRNLRRADSRPQMLTPPFFGRQPTPAPSMPALPFFMFPPPPGPPLPPYPSYPVQPTFVPRPYPPMQGYHSSPQRSFQHQMRPRFPGPVYPPTPPYAPGPIYASAFRSEPTYSFPCSHVPSSVSPAPVSVTPTPKITASATPVSKAPVSSVSSPARPPPAPMASVAPTRAASPPAPSPPPPYDGGPRRVTTDHGEVTLSVSECEIFSLLSSVDPNAAHWYIVDALSRAMAARAPEAGAGPARGPQSRLNPEASEFRSRPAPPLHPPPGFGAD